MGALPRLYGRSNPSVFTGKSKMAKLLNRAKMTVSGTPWDGDITLNAAVSGFASFAEAGAEDATVYTYVAEDGNDFEIGHGTYTESGTTFSRDTVLLSKISGTAGTTKLTLTSAATVAITIAAEDFNFATAAQGALADSAAQKASNLSDLASASTARTNLGLGTAAVKDTGSSGNAIPLLDGANTWGDKQTISNDTAFISHLDVISSDDTSNNGPRTSWLRSSPSPAVNDNLGILTFDALNASGARKNWFYINTKATGVAAGSEHLFLSFRGQNAGADNQLLSISPGLVLGNPTGGDKGLGSINATDLYNDNVAVTCMALAKEFVSKGEIDVDKWDALIPDVVIPAHEIEEPVMEDVALEYHSRVLDKDGDTVLVKKLKPWKRQVIEWHYVYDERGNGVDAFERPVTQKFIQPEKRIKREHGVARLFKKMCDDGFDPRNPIKYIAKLKTDEALPGMPTRAEWTLRGHNSISQSELFMRKWLAMEMLALVVVNHEDRLQAVEAKLKS